MNRKPIKRTTRDTRPPRAQRRLAKKETGNKLRSLSRIKQLLPEKKAEKKLKQNCQLYFVKIRTLTGKPAYYLRGSYNQAIPAKNIKPELEKLYKLKIFKGASPEQELARNVALINLENLEHAREQLKTREDPKLRDAARSYELILEHLIENELKNK